eukprot:COSAG05_NODE_2419_length_3086_cov_2.719451_1_plen_860_part_00
MDARAEETPVESMSIGDLQAVESALRQRAREALREARRRQRARGSLAATASQVPSPAPAPAKFSGHSAEDVSSMFIPSDFYDVISGELMQDPVMASDGHSYSFATITEWVQACVREGRPPTSPMTREVLQSSSVKKNITLAKAIEEYVSEREARNKAGKARPERGDPSTSTRTYADGTPCGVGVPRAQGVSSSKGVESLHELGRVYQHLDPLRKLLNDTLNGWQPPQLVAVGNEKAGKSTLLERLCMMPIFPHAEEICTRMKIEVRLRRSDRALPPRLEVYNVRSRKTESSRTVPMDGARVDVREVMDELVRRQNRKVTGVTRDYIIILHVQSPNVPTLDLVDLPGVVTAATAAEPSDMPRQTKSLVSNCIREAKDHSLFLCTVPADMAPNSSMGIQLLAEEGVLDRTVGVITMCDEMGRRHQAKLRERLNQRSDSVVLKPHGWVATMNAPAQVRGSNYAKLVHQAAEEHKFFVGLQMSDLIKAGSATTGVLIKKIEGMFLEYLKKKWVPTTMSKLNEERKSIADKNKQLGLPVANGNLSVPDLKILQQQATATVKKALDSKVEWMLDYFWRKVITIVSSSIQKLSRGSTSWEPGAVSAHLQNIAATVQKICEQAQQSSHGIIVQMIEAVLKCAEADISDKQANDQHQDFGWAASQRRQNRQQHQRNPESETKDTFQIGRFPVTVQCILEKVSKLWKAQSAILTDEIQRCINFHFQTPSSTVHITYSEQRNQSFHGHEPYGGQQARSNVSCSNVIDDLQSFVRGHGGGRISHQAQVHMNVERIRDDFVHIFVEHGFAVLQSNLSGQVSAIVAATIHADTVESCQRERRKLFKQAKRVDEAIAAMVPIFGHEACQTTTRT